MIEHLVCPVSPIFSKYYRRENAKSSTSASQQQVLGTKTAMPPQFHPQYQTSENEAIIKQRLSEKIVHSYAESRFDQETKLFLPHGLIEEFVTCETIVEELLGKDSLETGDLDLEEGEFKEIVDFVSQQAKVVFAIATVCQLRGLQLCQAMWNFRQAGFDDKSLPAIPRNHAVCFSNTIVWTAVRVHCFMNYQWLFLAPTFSPEHFSRLELEANHILPFTYKHGVAKEGAFGQVYMVQVHERHQIAGVLEKQNHTPKYAIKQFAAPSTDEEERVDAEKMWEEEVDALQEVSGFHHSHIIQCIAAITRGQQHYLMFLWADGGNLRDFWRDHPRPQRSPGLVKDVMNQIQGMAHALQKLHGYQDQQHYRHGDIKPENILNFPSTESEIGTFKISDLGSAKHHNVATGVRDRTAGKAYATIAYQPPESVTSRLSASSRLYDLWSLGCVALEFVVWLTNGQEGLELFKARRTTSQGELDAFFQVQGGSDGGPLVARVHSTVLQCFDQLSKHPECAEEMALGKLLYIIRTKLLVVQLPTRSPSLGGTGIAVTDTDATPVASHTSFGNHRISAEQLVKELDLILDHSLSKKDSYWSNGRSGSSLQFPLGAPRGMNYLSPAIPSIIADDNQGLSPGWTRQGPKLNSMMERGERRPGMGLSEAPGSLLVAPKNITNVRKC